MQPATRASLTIVVSALVAGAVVVGLLPAYWLFLATSLLVWSIALQSLGLVTGRTGMIALCQMSFAGVGAWVVGWLNVSQFPGGLALWVLIGGAAAVPFGIAIGLPALRLRGINLAIVTLSFATAFDSVLSTISFPGQTSFIPVPRPDAFASDAGYFVFVLIWFAAIAVALEFIARSRLGASWLAVRHSERAAAAHGIGIARAKLSAFAISAFIAGVSGGLLAGYLGTLVAGNFDMIQSLMLFAVATMTGAQFASGALIGGLLITIFPELLRRVGLPQDIGNVVFAIGATQALSTGESMSATLRRNLRRLAQRRTRAPPTSTAGSDAAPPPPRPPTAPTPPATATGSTGPVLAIERLSVRYGSVVALDDVHLSVPAHGVVGLIGPNGAGKSTLIDAVAGFLPSYAGCIRLHGRPIDPDAPQRRARGGVRRTWQTTRIAPELSVAEYLRLAAGALPPDELRAILRWLDGPEPDQPVAGVDAGTRRLLDVAGVVAARPAIALLDEPAAGQSFDTTLRLGRRIAEIPARFGCAVLLVEHDMDLVRAACSEVTVLDFGSVIARGATATTLDSAVVRKAYLGADDGADDGTARQASRNTMAAADGGPV
ncbi:MAG: branched-chain amino acid ABC transporter ATP-binding protein/permease [Ideonella sp.]|nr:branched-chain amino acid ABC transporter ATP-binding protein/permease [Ideonella sp.]